MRVRVLHTLDARHHVVGRDQAAEALRPFAGNLTYWLFAIGIIGTGMLAIPVLAGASSYAAAESFKWREGLYRKYPQAQAFYGTIILSVFVGLAINFIGIDPIKALIYAAVANGIVAPLVLALIVIISSNSGRDYRATAIDPDSNSASASIGLSQTLWSGGRIGHGT